MPSSILLRTFGGIPDQRAVLNQSNFVRPFNAGSWNKIRVCCRLSITDGGAGIFPIPNHIAIGLCSGSDRPFLSASCDLFLGAITSIGTGAFKVNVTRFAGPPMTMTNRLFPAKKTAATIVGITGTTAGPNPYVDSTSCQYDGVGGPFRSLLFVEITRPSGATSPTAGDYTIQLFHRGNNVPTVDASVANFQTQAIAAIPALGQHTYSNLPAMYSAPALTLNINASETVNGPLNHVCFACDDSKYNVEVSDIGIVRLI